jgi:hypothetical protein
MFITSDRFYADMPKAKTENSDFSVLLGKNPACPSRKGSAVYQLAGFRINIPCAAKTIEYSL